MRRKWKRALSLLCTLAMIAGMLPVSSLAAAGQAQTVDGGINGYAAAMQADEVTSDGWQTAFKADAIDGAQQIDGTGRSSALNGKIWTDKSVSIGDNNDFDVTFSALGQTFAGQETTTRRVALDVMFVLDRSQSMEGSRWRTAAAALNTAMNSLLIGEENANNRVGITVFRGDADSSTLPLAHYEKSGESDFISSIDNDSFRLRASNNISKTVDVDSGYGNNSGTYTQMGIAAGINALIASSTPDDGLTHIPVVILITDGEPNYYCSNTGNVTQNGRQDAEWYENVGQVIGARVVQTATSYKEKLENSYQSKYPNSDISARFFTIGQGMDNRDTYQVALLNPTVTNLQNARSDYNDSDATGLVEGLFGEYGQITDAYSYADGSFIGSMTQEDMENYFQTIFDSLGDLGVNTDVGESTGERNRITYFETLGEGVQFTGKMTLTVPKYKIVENEIQSLPSAQYTLTAYKEDGTELNPADGPAYLASGGVVTFRDMSHEEELANLSITVRQLSDGMRQMQVDIPPELMAYNVFITKSESGGTVYDYYEATQPLQLTYGVKMRADVETAGSYLVSAPTRSYVHFIPSSAQTVEGTYDMPYYWPGGQFANDQAQVDKNEIGGTGVDGASDYVTAATKGNNNDVYIYLGNNGLYQLTGKTMTLTVNWIDSNNQDGLRPSNLKVQLYADKGDGSIVPVEGSAVTLPAANTGNGNSLTYTFENLKVYLDGTTVAKYYVAFLGADGQPLTFTEVDHAAPFTD